MLIWPDCIPCVMKMALAVARLSMKEEGAIRDYAIEILTMPAMRGEEWTVTAPEIARRVWEKLVAITGDHDPLRDIKAKQNRKALELYEHARSQVKESKDPFLTALRLAIAANSIDAMVGLTHERALSGACADGSPDPALTAAGAEGLRGRIAEAEKIVYLTDNCGEILFDRLFLETVCEAGEKEVVVVTRALPILNDATVIEAKSVGLDRVGRLTDNGIGVPFPGTRIGLVSEEVRDLMLSANLVISKGVGNFDSLTEDKELCGRVSFLFHGKCHPCCAPRGVPLGTLIVDNQ